MKVIDKEAKEGILKIVNHALDTMYDYDVSLEKGVQRVYIQDSVVFLPDGCNYLKLTILYSE